MKAILLNRALLVLSFVGLFVAGVLSMGHLLDKSVPCGAGGGCEAVADHPASKLMGIPVAYLGFLCYVVLAGLAMARAGRGMRNVSGLTMAGYAIAGVGTVFSLYLQYQSFFVIKQTCPWCLTSAGIMILLLIGHAALAQLTPEAPDSQAAPVAADSYLMIGLPVLLVLSLAVMGFTMTQATNQPVMGGEEQSRIPQDYEAARKFLMGEDAHRLGPDDAPITIVEFADLQCKACQEKSPLVKAFAEEFPEKVQFAYRHFPLPMHKFATPAAAVAEYAAEKGKFWEYIMTVMAYNREVSGPEELYAAAEKVGLDTKDLQKRLANENDPIVQRVVRDMEAADQLGIVVTPTFFILVKGEAPVIASSNDIHEKLQSPPIRAILNAK